MDFAEWFMEYLQDTETRLRAMDQSGPAATFASAISAWETRDPCHPGWRAIRLLLNADNVGIGSAARRSLRSAADSIEAEAAAKRIEDARREVDERWRRARLALVSDPPEDSWGQGGEYECHATIPPDDDPPSQWRLIPCGLEPWGRKKKRTA